MKIEITGSKCVNCSRYIQYYRLVRNTVEAVDRGLCREKQCVTRPWERCGHYSEASNVGLPTTGQLLVKI